MPRILSTAILAGFSDFSAIDEDAGIIRGVKLMRVGMLACFAGENGEQKKVTITDAHISALLGHAGNRALPIHDTHLWHNSEGKPEADKVEKDARIGALKSFRRDENGDLIADAYLNKAKSAALDLLWGAKNNPEDNQFSAVFDYRKDDPLCMPVNFRAADVVPSGAAVTALFSEDNQSSTMTKEELIKLLADPEVKAAVIELCTTDEATMNKFTDVIQKKQASPPSIAAMEAEAGVTDADKKPEDEEKPALMRAMIRVSRAIGRKATELTANKSAILAEAKVQAAAETTALLGKGGFINQGDGKTGDQVTAKLAGYIADKSAKDRPSAILVLARREPDIYNAALAAGKL